jgi:hypothetical protein
VVLLEMNERLDTIVADNNLRTTVFELIMWAKRQGRVGELINAAAGAKPGKALMAALARDAAGWGLETPIAAPVAQPAGGPAVAQPQQSGTPLKVDLFFKMAYVPTAVIHLLDPAQYPLVQVQVTNTAPFARRIAVVTGVEGYSDTSSATLDLGAAGTPTAMLPCVQRPVFRREALRPLNDLVQATVRVQIEDLDSARKQQDVTKAIWMLGRNLAPIAVRDEAANTKRLMLPYLGAFVTENEPSVKAYLKTVATFHPEKKLAGYYVADKPRGVRSQVEALSKALQQSGKLTYAPSLVKTVDENDYQQVRLPRECLDVGLANCIEGVVLYCSLLEAMGLQAAIVWNRQHAVVGWRESGAAGAPWFYLDTTKVDEGTFENAMNWGAAFVEDNAGEPPERFGILPIRDLRAQGITPLE